MDLLALKKTLATTTDRASENLSTVQEYIASLISGLDALDTNTTQIELIAAVKECADASRDEEWRNPLGDAGILEMVADLLGQSAAEKDTELRVQALRLVANCCAENDSNRQRVTSRPQGLKPILKLFSHESLLHFAIPVSYNICLDYEPAQRQAIADGAAEAVFELLKNHNAFDEEGLITGHVEMMLKLLEMMASQDILKDTLDPAYISVLLDLALSPELSDLDIYTLILNIATALLGHTAIQMHVIESVGVETVMGILEDSYSRFPTSDSTDKDTVKILSYNRKKLIMALSDISSNPKFTKKHSITDSPFLGKLHSRLSSPPSDDKYLDEALQTAACIVLGNVATSDEACLTLVKRLEIHLPLIKLMGQRNKDAGTVFSAVGMLRNLSLPMENKSIIGNPETGLWEALENRWIAGTEAGVEQQVPYAIAGLGRLLVKGCPSNAKYLLGPPSVIPPSFQAPKSTRLSLLLQTYAKIDELPTRTEISRTIAEVLRALAAEARTTSDPGLITNLENILYDSGEVYQNHDLIPKAISAMVEQDKFPVVRSEGLFAFGLMVTGLGRKGATAVDGARRVWQIRDQWWGPLNGDPPKAGTEKAEDSTAVTVNGAGMAVPAPEARALQKGDRENAMVMIAELRRNLDPELSEQDKQDLDNILLKLSGSMFDGMTIGGI